MRYGVLLQQQQNKANSSSTNSNSSCSNNNYIYNQLNRGETCSCPSLNAEDFMQVLTIYTKEEYQVVP